MKGLEILQDRLNQYSAAVGAVMTIGKDERGYYITYDGNPIALTSGRNITELTAYIDGLRDMLLIVVLRKG